VAGGVKVVDVPATRFAALTKWPRYGDAEKKAVWDLLETNRYYQELPLFEKEWQTYTQSPVRQGAHQRQQRPDQHVFRPGPPAGQ
jgi:hypothetical protein